MSMIPEVSTVLLDGRKEQGWLAGWQGIRRCFVHTLSGDKRPRERPLPPSTCGELAYSGALSVDSCRATTSEQMYHPTYLPVRSVHRYHGRYLLATAATRQIINERHSSTWHLPLLFLLSANLILYLSPTSRTRISTSIPYASIYHDL